MHFTIATVSLCCIHSSPQLHALPRADRARLASSLLSVGHLHLGLCLFDMTSSVDARSVAELLAAYTGLVPTPIWSPSLLHQLSMDTTRAAKRKAAGADAPAPLDCVARDRVL
jgi:hypothetical protein